MTGALVVPDNDIALIKFLMKSTVNNVNDFHKLADISCAIYFPWRALTAYQKRIPFVSVATGDQILRTDASLEP